LLLLFVLLLVLLIVSRGLTTLNAPRHGGRGSGDYGRAGCHTKKSHAFPSISE
jgi:hypothetical protein